MRTVFVLLLVAACDYQPRPGSAKAAPATAATPVTAAAPCQLTLAVDGMT